MNGGIQMAALTESDLIGLPPEVADVLRQRMTAVEQERSWSWGESFTQPITPSEPPYLGKDAVEPLPKKLLGEIKTYRKSLRNVETLNDKFRESMKIRRAANVLVNAGYPIPEVTFPEYFTRVNEERLNQGFYHRRIAKNLSEQYPDIGFYGYGDFISARPKAEQRQFNKELIKEYAQRYCQAIADRDDTLGYRFTETDNRVYLTMKAAASNLYDRDESGHLVPDLYPWLQEIVDSGLRLPIVQAQWVIRTNRTLDRYNFPPEAYLNVIANRHISSHNCYGSVIDSIRDTKLLKQAIARAYTALVSMNLFESASFPYYREGRFFKFYNTQTKQIEMVDTHYYKCKHCIDLESCRERGCTNDCHVYDHNGAAVTTNDGDSQDTN